jgi:Ni/Fe-hydrogenase b-type cytochrome subunit
MSKDDSGSASDANDRILVHPAIVRVTHWINAAAMLVMISSGWRIYNASPLFGFTFPDDVALGGWLAGALRWHFAAMWVLAANGIAYLMYGIFSGHYRRNFLPVTPQSIARAFGNALRGKLPHQTGVYNPLQRLAYLGVVVLGIVVVLSGLALWKPVQLQLIAALLGGYEGARYVHFLCMSGLVLFIVIHIVLVILVPRTFVPMLSGRARKESPGTP